MVAFTEVELDQAARDVFRECRKDAVPDILRLADYEADWPSIRAGLLTRLAANMFQPQAPEIVEMPKSELASRPIAILKVEDRIVYQAVMNRMALAIDTELTEEVFSARSRSTKHGKVYRPDQRRAWLAFQKQGKELCTRYSEACMVTTDITSYYEFVSIPRLIEELHRVPGVAADDANLLRRLLEGWNKGPLNGLPQGADVSAILGNFYLKPLDAILRKLPVKFVRFQDDIKIFAESAPVLRRAVAELTPVIRRRHLNLSSAKT